MEQITSPLLAVRSSNLLVNGGFETWSRGNGAFSTTNTYGPDRWSLAIAGTDTLAVSRNSSPVAAGSNYCAGCTYTRASDNSYLSQTLKVSDGHQVQGQVFSASARVYCTVLGVLRLSMWCDGTGSFSVNSGNNTVTNAWQTLTLTTPVLPTNATYLTLGLVFANASATGWWDNVMLVLGSVAADYAPMHPADEQTRSMRYYQKHGGVAAAFAFNSYGGAGGYVGIWLPMPVQFAGTPTYTKVGTWTLVNCSQPLIGSGPTPSGTQLYTTATAAGTTNFYCTDSTCYLTGEYNP